ncbi:hypothetical protein EJ06DRAFT_529753 [Trichodelitschia bisporula]|uniref:RING-type domain-containing protein n=1 Tax=Trichodelitschia bisporula TaxID=703511 RepID=A0A6G1HXF0_9PEZI|nr:hypothetical protein EJ06DRAFT_529753 [Trichodelitschia bisporula]
MADQCAICLEPNTFPASPNGVKTLKSIPKDERVACLKPCKHHLHDACVRPWLATCSACPLCRQEVVEVALVLEVNGPAIGQYPVVPVKQRAEVDPDLEAEEEEEEPEQFQGLPCDICSTDSRDTHLMLCDTPGCLNTRHWDCAGFSSLPAGDWYCDECMDQQWNVRELIYLRTQARRHLRARCLDPPNTYWTHDWPSSWVPFMARRGINLQHLVGPQMEIIVRGVMEKLEGNQRPLPSQQRSDQRPSSSHQRIGQRPSSSRQRRDSSSDHEIREGRPRPQPPTPDHTTAEEEEAWKAFDQTRQPKRAASSDPDDESERPRKRARPTENARHISRRTSGHSVAGPSSSSASRSARPEPSAHSSRSAPVSSRIPAQACPPPQIASSLQGPRAAASPEVRAVSIPPAPAFAANIPWSLKEELRKLTKTALTPFWRGGKIHSKEYEDINRLVSRRLYSKVMRDWNDLHTDRQQTMHDLAIYANVQVKIAVDDCGKARKERSRPP